MAFSFCVTRIGKLTHKRIFPSLGINSKLSEFKREYSIKNVTVLGGGLMGSGIAQVAAQTGHNVTLVDLSEDVLKNSLSSIEKSLARVAKKQFKGNTNEEVKFTRESLGRIKTLTSAEEAVQNADIVVEAVVENISVKHKVFSAIDAVAPKSTIFASNTSSMSISEIASCTKRLDRFGGLHFFNPVPVMRLLEVVRTTDTSEETYNTLMAFGEKLGKTTVTCKDTPGFIVNRLLIPFNREALKMYERGDATFQDIDIAMKLGAGYPMGPFELLDYTGLDLAKMIGDDWAKKYPNNPIFQASDVITKMVNQGKLGRKSGEGFYNYTKK